MPPLNVNVRHDPVAGVWFVEDSDVPGLHVEAETYEALVEIVLDLAPDLMDANAGGADGAGIPLCIRHQAITKRAAAA